MNGKAAELFIGVVFLVFALIFFWVGHQSEDQRNNWIQGEGLVLSSYETIDSDDEGNHFTSWICTISYTKEDGSEWVKEDVYCYLPSYEGDTVDIIYDPDSDKMEFGDLPDKSDSEFINEGATWIAVISGGLILHAIIGTIIEKRRPSKAEGQ